MMAVEARIQLPQVNDMNGQGYWPAFWMLGAPYRGDYNNWPDKMDNHGADGQVFAFLDGHAEWVTKKTFLRVWNIGGDSNYLGPTGPY